MSGNLKSTVDVVPAVPPSPAEVEKFSSNQLSILPLVVLGVPSILSKGK